MKTIACLLAVGVTEVVSAAVPFYMIRLRSCETDDEQVWAETRAALEANRGCCDEVWFSTGISYPPLEAHRARAAKQAKAAADCRRLGIEPGLQIQATLGHSDDITVSGGDVSAKDWTGWTGSQGVEDKWCSCPRDPKFIAYFEEVGRIYAAYRPTSVWIDDDLRIGNHRPATDGSLPGCWCARCVGDFARETGVARTRETLAAAVKADVALAARWERFQFASLAELARRIAKAVAEVSPETRMGYQHCLRADGLQTLVYDAMREASGHAVRSRPGGGAYFDYDPRDQLIKAYFMARQRAAISGAKDIEQFCPEIETCPRKFSCRTPRGVLLESLENLALGMDSLSFLITDSRFEKMSWYGRTFFRALAENRACLYGYAEASRGAEPTGLRYAPVGKAGAEVRELRWTAYCSGVPLVGALGRDVGAYDDFISRNGGKLDVTASSTAEIVGRSQMADQVAGGRLPVVLEDPVVGFVMPRTTASGELKTVAFVNTSIGRTEPTRLKLRGVPQAAKTARWWALDARPVELPLARSGAEARVVLPPVEGWSAGWLGF